MAKTGEQQNGWESKLKFYEIIRRDYTYFEVVPEEIEGANEMEQFARLEVVCPGCGATFWVDEDEWVKKIYNKIKKELVMVGRSCPYCYCTARIPHEYRQGEW